MKKHFNKHLIITEGEEQFQLSNTCWIYEKLIEHEKVLKDHCHITRKYRGGAYWGCIVNLQLTTKLPVIFHNLRGYDSHLIFNELKKFSVKIDVIPNGLEIHDIFCK